MIVALIDNGSLEPAAHLNLRTLAAALSTRTGTKVHSVSWKHSDRISTEALNDTPAWTLAPFVRYMFALGQREFAFIPFFISPQGAIGSALRRDLERLQRELGDFSFSFTDGLATRGALAGIVADRVQKTIAGNQLVRPPVILVDHGGPSRESAALRDAIAREIGASAATSMEGVHPPLLADELRRPEYENRDVVIAMLFLAPGRHAGADGDVAQLCRASRARCHRTPLVGDHPTVVEVLAGALRDSLLAEVSADVS